ncbi:protein transport protein Sec24A-like isoform X3 [Sarcoptes scabiei]|nr:protein transport protein Sec24A-like isoform X3 [Sarcoptes scabiei]
MANHPPSSMIYPKTFSSVDDQHQFHQQQRQSSQQQQISPMSQSYSHSGTMNSLPESSGMMNLTANHHLQYQSQQSPQQQHFSPNYQNYSSQFSSHQQPQLFTRPAMPFTQASNQNFYSNQFHSQASSVGGYQQKNSMDHLTQKMSSMSVNQGWNNLWRMEHVNLLAEKDIYSKAYQHEQQQRKNPPQTKNLNCDKDVMRCTLNKIPESASLLQKSRLPLGIILHPFTSMPNIPVVQDSVIVRCRTCRTYINPFVRLIDQRRWQCNLCHRINEAPEEFIYDYRTRKPIDIMTRPELNHCSIEFVASVEYMVRPPQPAIYLFVFECTASAIQLGYIKHLSAAILESIDRMPGDSRSLIGFIAFDSKLHFFNLNEDRPVHMIMPDIHDVFLPHSDALLVNIHTCREKIVYFLENVLPKFPCESSLGDPTKLAADHQSALGPALQVALKLISSTGGRITLVQTSLPTAGNLSQGCVLQNREDPNSRTINSQSSNNALTPLLNPATDFFKKLALECSEHQVTVDLFNLSSSFSDLATIAAISKYSGGSIKYYGSGGNPSSPPSLCAMLNRFKEDLKHYLTREIGFEAVMRVRSTRGVSIHTFHGNLFFRSSDLIALPITNPDSAFGIQLTISEDLKDFNQVCLQSALLYTNSNGERRIRVHTLSLPVISDLAEIMDSADQEAIISLLAKMAVDRSCQSSIQDAREALINSNIDFINSYRLINSPSSPGLFISHQTRLLPLYTLALLKHTSFRMGISTRIDERVYAMEQMKTMPNKYLMLYIYPNLYPIHYEFDPLESPPTPLQLSFANIDRDGVYLLDTYDHLFIYVCKSVNPNFLRDVFDVTHFSQIQDDGDQNTTTVSNTPPAMMMINNQRPSHAMFPNPNISSQSMNGYAEDLSNSKPTVGEGPRDNPNWNDLNGKLSENGTIYRNQNGSLDDTNAFTQKSYQQSSIIKLPQLENLTSKRIHAFIKKLIDDRPFKPCFHILREDSRLRYTFLQYMYDDRNESAFSYYEFLQHLLQNIEK